MSSVTRVDPGYRHLNGRDHNNHGFTIWLAGGGVLGGYVHGATYETGFQAADKIVHVHVSRSAEN